jgi:hypothetical protein
MKQLGGNVLVFDPANFGEELIRENGADGMSDPPSAMLRRGRHRTRRE